MIKAEINLDDLLASLGIMQRAMAQAVPCAPLLKRIGRVLDSQTRKRFDEGIDPEGKAWPPLKKPRAHGRGGNKPLRDKGLLMASVSAMGRGHVEEIQQDTLTWGTSLSYAAVHQIGSRAWQQGQKDVRQKQGKLTITARRETTRGPVIPARPYLGLSQANIDEIVDVAADYLMAQLKG